MRAIREGGIVTWFQPQVALRPGETEVLDSNLDSQETAALFEAAQDAFRREVEGDAALRARARSSRSFAWS